MGKAKHLKDTRNSTQRSASLIWTKKQHEEKISNDGKEYHDSLCASFFAFCFFSFLCPSLQGHGIRYTARFHAPVAENSAKKRPFVKQKESKQYSLTCSGARRSGCSEAAADGLHTDRQIAAGVPLDGIVVVRVERLQEWPFCLALFSSHAYCFQDIGHCYV